MWQPLISSECLLLRMVILSLGGAGAHAIDAEPSLSLARLPGADYAIRYPPSAKARVDHCNRVRVNSVAGVSASCRIRYLRKGERRKELESAIRYGGQERAPLNS